MRLFSYCQLILLMVTPFLISAKEMTLQVKKHSISLDLPESWRIEKNVMGMPLSLWGRVDKAGFRPVLSINVIDRSIAKQFELKSIEEIEKVYRQERQSWFQKHQATSISYIQAHDELIADKYRRYTFGTQYLLGAQRIEEKSYYLFCPTGLVQLKIMERGRLSEQADLVAKGVRCAL